MGWVRTPEQTQISIHALREEGDGFTSDHFSVVDKISIHALREEGDLTGARSKAAGREFLSTPSARRATNHIVLPPIT